MKIMSISCDVCGKPVPPKESRLSNRYGYKLGQIVLRLVATSQQSEDECRLDEDNVHVCVGCAQRIVREGQFVETDADGCWPDSYSDAPIAKVREMLKSSGT